MDPAGFNMQMHQIEELDWTARSKSNVLPTLGKNLQQKNLSKFKDPTMESIAVSKDVIASKQNDIVVGLQE